MHARLSTMFQSLQVRNYRLFASGQLVKLIGVWMMFIAQDWLVLELSDDSATALGVVVALQFTPVLLLTLLSGRLADRYDKRMLLFVANAFWTVLSLAMSVLVLTGLVQLWHVFVFAALLGVANAVETPVRQAFVSELVGTSLLPNALSLNAAVFNSARIVGPAIAGLAIALVDVGPVFMVTALSSIGPLITVIQMRPAELHREPLLPRDERAAATVLDGLRYVGRRPDLLLPMVVMSVIGMSLFNFQLTLAALAKTVFNTGAASFGLFSTTLAAGALVGALAGTGRRSRPSVWLVLGAAIACAAFGTLVGLAPEYWMVLVLLPPTGFCMVYFAQAANQRVQLGTDAAFRGRVMALWVLVFLGTNPVGAPIIGWIAETFGAGASIWAGGLLSLTTALLALAWQLRRAGARLRFRILPMPRFYVTEA
ncbi:Predicted arabinose efflux permease, MFS family [Micromonospora phaseoli]|uniref:Predicted arabinose efflux permease, MFS family n=1 Tax=Micromonospora phaseoli TaxID=1144548 RepID=A0A1H7AR01_9ACTN|nr:MFS transporter [Micromonospora phaseoli]PZV96399.1 putative MFS family arabinose efflux permease [Micromonospora phaseoli]GIJ76086.1 MFS transporter [Micromonospora phaseoli]SEJ64512.1 Predicted arabinose efflux permease, MFS family [Micromonospora phaseoli]